MVVQEGEANAVPVGFPLSPPPSLTLVYLGSVHMRINMKT